MAYVAVVHRAQLKIQTNVMATRRLRTVMNDVQRDARVFASTGLYSTTKDLARSIKTDGPSILGFKVTAEVGSRLSYAASVESGAKIHDIFPIGSPHVYHFEGFIRGRGPRLKFYWRKAGRTVYTPQVPMGPGTVGVSHPGQKGKRYLARALELAAVKYRMRLVLYER